MSIQLLDFSNFKKKLPETKYSYVWLTTPVHLEIQAHDFYLVRFLHVQSARRDPNTLAELTPLRTLRNTNVPKLFR